MKAPEEETDPIAISTKLLSSLMDEIPLVQTFKGKWSLICAKLDNLRPQLTDNSVVVSNSDSLPRREAVRAESRNLITRSRNSTMDFPLGFMRERRERERERERRREQRADKEGRRDERENESLPWYFTKIPSLTRSHALHMINSVKILIEFD
ncbi:hypothetical protein L484_006094 [Morus notabilis]|uniref:DUF7032 domain-containing protein n=1 Tax=Morus notabilis TaxID=981085 RepID=W9S335_9ROSA|nr:hypothetical protein L484_006094 [Morus notabilis]